jgi:hypothetical protein
MRGENTGPVGHDPPDLRRLVRQGLLVEDLELHGPVVRLARLLYLLEVDLEHPLLDHFPAARVDGVGDVGVHLLARALGPASPVAAETGPTVVAKARPVVVLPSASGAAFRQLPRRHGHEGPLRPFDHLEVPNHKVVVNGDAAKRAQFVVLDIHELHAHFCDFHRDAPFRLNRRRLL